MLTRLKDLRTDSDKTQKQTAEIFSMQPTQYGRYEKGERILPLDVAVCIAKHYNVSLDYIAMLTNDKGGLHCNLLNDEEKQLIEIWKCLSNKNKSLMKANMEALADKKPQNVERKYVI